MILISVTRRYLSGCFFSPGFCVNLSFVCKNQLHLMKRLLSEHEFSLYRPVRCVALPSALWIFDQLGWVEHSIHSRKSKNTEISFCLFHFCVALYPRKFRSYVGASHSYPVWWVLHPVVGCTLHGIHNLHTVLKISDFNLADSKAVIGSLR